MFTFSQPGRIVFGFGTISRVGKEARSLAGGPRAQVITDSKLMEMGMVEPVIEAMRAAGLETEVWAGVAGEPTQGLIEECRKDIKSYSPDVFVGFGGGSSIDVAKIVAGLMTNPKDLHEYFMKDLGVGRFENPSKPVLAVPTTAGTGAENTWLAITSLDDVEGKVGFADPKIIPPKALVDPGLTTALPPEITASTGIDALTHIIEPYLNANTNPFTEALALQAVRIVPAHLPRAFKDGNDREARFQMMMQATLGGLTLNYGGVSEGHLIGQMVGGRYHIPHGVSQGIAMPYCLRYSLDTFPEGMANLAKWWGIDISGLEIREAGLELIKASVDLLKELGIPWNLRQIEGVRRDDLPEMARSIATTPYFVTTAASCCRKINTESDYLWILDRMYEGNFLD
jgi:alcohol dehydrogenase class IV